KDSMKPFIHSYWKLNKETSINISASDAIEKFTEMLSLSVKRRLRADVTVGTSLSGGLDSSSIIATLSKFNNRPSSFSAVFPGFEKDESKYIRKIAGKFNLKNFQVQPTAAGLINDFEKLAYHQEEPFPSSSIYAQYKVFELAATHDVKVLLDGQGADETLAGYTRYVHWYLQEVLSRHKLGAARKERNALLKNKIPFRWGINNVFAAFLPSHAAIQLEKNEYRKTISQPDISREFLFAFRGKAWEGIHKPIVTKLNDILHFNVMESGLEELLRFADRNSMAHGREVRLPFLDHELVKFIFSLPSTFKIHDGWTKWILRQTMDKKLPAEIVWRTDKIGYEPPQENWMQDSLFTDFIHEARKKLVNKGILKSSVLNKKIQPMTAHHADNFDWRYLSAAQIL
ncbi:MAG: asparagine synthase C-terminal domain-containing protein, partial [Ferruginibacter sp.]